MGNNPSSYALLQGANERLFALRQQQKGRKSSVADQLITEPNPNGPSLNGKTAVSHSPSSIPSTYTTIINSLPTHLGWGSAALTAVCRQQPDEPKSTIVSQETMASNATPEEQPTIYHNTLNLHNETIKLYPDIARAMLRQELANSGRLWLALRYLDQKQQGWLRIDVARERLTKKTAVLRLFGWRQLRNLLQTGKGIFWERDRDRIWLYGVEKVAQKLEISRLRGFPIKLPLQHLTQGIGVFRAHLYASIHSGRRQANPISRERLKQLSGITPRTQRQYDRIARVKRVQNIAIGGRATNVSWETMAWERGGGVFELKDKDGRLGPQNATYLAWQLPNRYVGPHEQCGKGRQKKINQNLVDLVNAGMRGNGRSDIESSPQRLYCHDATTAVRQATKENPHVYWPMAENGRSTQLWHVLAGV